MAYKITVSVFRMSRLLLCCFPTYQIHPQRPGGPRQETHERNMTMTDTLTLARWLVYWLETYVKPTAKPSGYAQYRDICTGHIIPAMGNTPLEAVTTANALRFFNIKAKTQRDFRA